MNYSTFSFLPDYLKSFFRLIGPVYAARMVATVIIVFLVGYLFSLLSPAAGEAFLYNQMILSGWMVAGFAGVVTLLVLGCGALFASLCISYGYKFARNEISATNGEVRQLSGGGQYYVGPDIVVVQGEYESRNVFNARVTDFIDNQKQGQWIVALPFQEGYIKIKDDTAKGKQVKRGGEATDKDDYDGMLPHYNPMSFANETRSDYNAYINEFLPRFKTYAEWYRAEKLKQPAFNHVGTITTIFLFLLLSLSATAQTNTDRVYQFLGSAATQKPGIDEPVVFEFEKHRAVRYGDNETEIGRMVAQRVGADDADYGQLKAVYRSGSLIPVSGKQQISATGTNEKPAELFKTRMEAPQIGSGSAVDIKGIPDSATTARAIENAEKYIIENGKQIERYSWQWWSSSLAEWALFIIACVVAFFRSLSKSAYGESKMRRNGWAVYNNFILNIGHWAGGLTFLSLWLAGFVLLPVAFYVIHSYGFWTLVFSFWSWKTLMILGVFALGELWCWIVNKGVPNPQTNDDEPYSYRPPSQQKGLDSGR